MKPKIKPLWIIFFTVFIDLLGFGILVPVIPLLLADPNSSEYILPKNLSLDHGYIILGLLVAVFSLGQFLAAPILGQLSDKYGRRKIMALSIFGTAVSYIFFAVGIITRNIPLLFASRAFDGITAGVISTAQATIADISKPEERTKNFGLMAAALGIGFILGPFIGGKLSSPEIISWFNAATPFWFAAGLSFVNFVFIILFFPETLKNPLKNDRLKWGKSIQNIFHALESKQLKNLFLVTFLHHSGFAFYTTFFAVFLIHRFGFNQGNIGDYFAFIGVWGIITQALIVGKISKYFKEEQVLTVSLFSSGLVILSYFLVFDWRFIILIAPPFAIFNGLSMTNTAGLISKQVSDSRQGEVLGIASSLQALGRTLPPAIAGFVAAESYPESPILVGAAIIVLAGFIFIVIRRKTDSLLGKIYL